MAHKKPQRRNVLAVIGDRALFGRLAGRLNRSVLEVNLSHSAENATFFCSVIRFELILISLPLADSTLDELLASVHRPGGPCADTPVLVLAEHGEVALLRRRLGGELVEVMSSGELGTELEERVNRRLGTGALTAERVGVALTATVRTAGEDPPRVLTSRNLSESGVLLRTAEPLPVGAVVEIDLDLPGESSPLRLAAEVVRHTLPSQERIRGMGLRFVELRDAQRQTLRRFVAERLPERR